MHQVLLTLGQLPVSGFGFFLAASFIIGLFIIWRLCLAYDIDEEQTLDISLLTFFGGLIGARIFFWLTNLDQFDNLLKVILVNRYPGLNFWGGMLAGILSLRLFSRRLKLQFWQIADFVIVGVFAALSLGSLGCLLGSCQYGIPTDAWYGITQVGILGKRFPIQVISSFAYFLAFIYLWRISLRFHFTGKVASVGLIILGLVKYFSDFWRGDAQWVSSKLSLGQFFALMAFVSGVVVFYKEGKRSIKQDLLWPIEFFDNPQLRRKTLSRAKKGWYNSKVNFVITLTRFRRSFISWSRSVLTKINVRSNPPKF